MKTSSTRLRYINFDLFIHFLLNPAQAFIDHILWGFGALFFFGTHRLPTEDCPARRSFASVLLQHTKSLWKYFWDNRSLIKCRPQSERDIAGYGDESVDPCWTDWGKHPEPWSRLFEWYSYLYDEYLG